MAVVVAFLLWIVTDLRIVRLLDFLAEEEEGWGQVPRAAVRAGQGLRSNDTWRPASSLIEAT